VAGGEWRGGERRTRGKGEVWGGEYSTLVVGGIDASDWVKQCMLMDTEGKQLR